MKRTQHLKTYHLQHIKHNMNLLDQLLDKLAPHECLGCGVESTLLCPACADRLVPALERCYRCHSLASGAVTCAACRQSSRLHSLRAVCVYQDAAKALIYKLKLAGARAATLQMAALMQAVLAGRQAGVPSRYRCQTAATRVRLRRLDQAELLARELARQTDCHYLAGLARLTQTQQHGAHRAQRLQQLSSAFRVSQPQLAMRAEQSS